MQIYTYYYSYAEKIKELSNWFYFCMYAWPSVVTIRIEIIIMKTQIIFNIQHRRSPIDRLF